jgi:hypothetical protein
MYKIRKFINEEPLIIIGVCVIALFLQIQLILSALKEIPYMAPIAQNRNADRGVVLTDAQKNQIQQDARLSPPKLTASQKTKITNDAKKPLPQLTDEQRAQIERDATL